jgi:hypothetical protein
MVLRHSTRSVLLFIGLASCTVYDDAALGRKASSTIEQRQALDGGNAATNRVQTAVGCDGEPCVTRSDAGIIERDALRDAAPDRVTREQREQREKPDRPVQPDEPDESERTETQDAATAPHDSGQSGARSTPEVPDAEAESGFCSACDSRPATSPVLSDTGGKGSVTTYGSVMSPQPSTGGACNYGATGIDHYAAINVGDAAGADGAEGQWQGGRICGQCAAVSVKTPEDWKDTVVRIVDKCSDANCGIAVSGSAARELMGERPGRYDGKWRFVSCTGHPKASNGAPSLRVKEGSSTWWALVHVRNPAQAVSAIDWQSSDGASTGSFAYATEAENFYRVPEAIHSHGMVRLTVHYRDDSRVEVVLAPSQLAQPASEIALP